MLVPESNHNVFFWVWGIGSLVFGVLSCEFILFRSVLNKLVIFVGSVQISLCNYLLSHELLSIAEGTDYVLTLVSVTSIMLFGAIVADKTSFFFKFLYFFFRPLRSNICLELLVPFVVFLKLMSFASRRPSTNHERRFRYLFSQFTLWLVDIFINKLDSDVLTIIFWIPQNLLLALEIDGWDSFLQFVENVLRVKEVQALAGIPRWFRFVFSLLLVLFFLVDVRVTYSDSLLFICNFFLRNTLNMIWWRLLIIDQYCLTVVKFVFGSRLGSGWKSMLPSHSP